MGIDLTGVQKKKRAVRRHTLSSNPYLKLLIKLYKFLAKRTTSNFNKTIFRRLVKSRSNRAPISLSRVASVFHRRSVWRDPKKPAPIAVIVGDVLDDLRCTRLPGVKICALRFSKGARARIINAGGECITFDQLATIAPTGKNTFLLRGRKAGRESLKHFGAPGVPGSHVKPRVTSRGADRSRGRRPSKGYKRASFKHK